MIILKESTTWQKSYICTSMRELKMITISELIPHDYILKFTEKQEDPPTNIKEIFLKAQINRNSNTIEI